MTARGAVGSRDTKSNRTPGTARSRNLLRAYDMTAPRPEAEVPQTGLDDCFVKWIPLVVPLLALFLATMVAVIGVEIL